MAKNNESDFLEVVHEVYEIKGGQILGIDIDIPNFKVSRSFTGKCPGCFVNKPSNGDVTPIEITERTSLDVKFVGTKDLKGKNYRLRAGQLIGSIVPELSSITFRKGQIQLRLHKEEARSWYPQLADGLDLATSPEDIEMAECGDNEGH